MLNLVQPLSFFFTITMRPISAAQHFLAVSLLNKGYSQHWIQTRTDLGKVTVGRINNEMERKKENHAGGCPSKLSTHHNHTILCQITTGKLNNAVQATKFINSIIPTFFLSQTVRKILKEAGLHSTTKKFLCWRLAIGNKCSSLHNIMEIGLWRAGRGFYEVMRLKLIRLGQIERCMCEKREVNPHLIRPLHLQSNMEKGYKPVLWNFGWVSGGELWKVGYWKGARVFSAGQ